MLTLRNGTKLQLASTLAKCDILGIFNFEPHPDIEHVYVSIQRNSVYLFRDFLNGFGTFYEIDSSLVLPNKRTVSEGIARITPAQENEILKEQGISFTNADVIRDFGLSPVRWFENLFCGHGERARIYAAQFATGFITLSVTARARAA